MLVEDAGPNSYAICYFCEKDSPDYYLYHTDKKITRVYGICLRCSEKLEEDYYKDE
jgi:hypothetical protein